MCFLADNEFLFDIFSLECVCNYRISRALMAINVIFYDEIQEHKQAFDNEDLGTVIPM